MPRLHRSRHIIRVLESHGFQFISQKGSHCKFRKDAATVIVPHPKPEIPVGTFLSILRQSGLKRDDFAE